MVFRQFAYLAVAAAVLLEGCRKENLSGDAVPLSFAAAFAGETRAPSAVQPDQADYLIAEGNRIGVFGTLTRAGEEESTVFEKQAVTCGSDLSWSYRPLKYWRKTGLYDFTAVFPYDSDCLAGTTGKRLLIRHSAAAKNVDILVSRAQRDVSGGNTSPVDLTFHHACAAVRFLFRTSEHYDYRLYSFQLENLRVVGTLDTDDGIPSLDDWSTSGMAAAPVVWPWTASSEAGRIPIPSRYEDYTGGTWYYMIPQSLAVSGNRPSVTFSVLFNGEPTPVHTTLALPDSIEEGGVPTEARWEPGKVYTYYINLQPSRVSIDVHVTPWDSSVVAVDDIIFG